jgi:ProP effector
MHENQPTTPSAAPPELQATALESAAATEPTPPVEPVVVAEATAEPAPAEEPTTELPAAAADAEPAPAAPRASNELSPNACARELAQRFPALFDPAQPPKPLKLRIQADIQQRAPGVFSKKAMGIYFSRYTTSNPYLKALLQQPHRFDLDGQPAGEISEEHRTAATEELARRRALHEERRAAERQAQREAHREAQRAEQQARQAQHALEPAAPAARPPAERHAERPAQRAAEPRGERPAPRQPRPPQPAQQAPRQPERQVESNEQRERASLLHAFEASPLKKGNFCVLKGISEADLDAQLVLARRERELWRAQRPATPAPVSAPPQRPGGHDGPRREGRPPRRSPRG